MTSKTSNFKFVVNPDAAASFHDRGIAILHAGNGRLFTSNETGARIWRGLEQHLSLEAIADKISSEYQIAITTAREHTVRFLSKLEQHALVQRGVA
jgi:Coenzyme PQQ synthesis protein D (PqqD)